MVRLLLWTKTFVESISVALASRSERNRVIYLKSFAKCSSSSAAIKGKEQTCPPFPKWRNQLKWTATASSADLTRMSSLGRWVRASSRMKPTVGEIGLMAVEASMCCLPLTIKIPEFQ